MDDRSLQMNFDRRLGLQIQRYFIVSGVPLVGYLFLLSSSDSLLNRLANIALVYFVLSLFQIYFVTRSYINAEITGDILHIRTRLGWSAKEYDLGFSMIEKYSREVFSQFILLKNGDRIRVKKGLPDIFLVRFSSDFEMFLNARIQERNQTQPAFEKDLI